MDSGSLRLNSESLRAVFNCLGEIMISERDFPQPKHRRRRGVVRRQHPVEKGLCCLGAIQVEIDFRQTQQDNFVRSYLRSASQTSGAAAGAALRVTVLTGSSGARA